MPAHLPLDLCGRIATEWLIHMKKRIITISREFGSGGRSIGKALADRLNLAYYDKQIVDEVALKTGFDPEFIEDQGEYAPGKTFLSYIFGAQGVPGVMNGMSATDFLWMIQRQVILQLSEEKPCVIVGRCADYILKDRDDCLHVFIHADMPYRAERIVRLYGESESSPEKRLHDKDTKRRVNYAHYTQREWGMAQNYHLSLNTAIINPETCTDIIEKLFLSE